MFFEDGLLILESIRYVLISCQDNKVSQQL
jgi:hypothetical protein